MTKTNILHRLTLLVISISMTWTFTVPISKANSDRVIQTKTGANCQSTCNITSWGAWQRKPGYYKEVRPGYGYYTCENWVQRERLFDDLANEWAHYNQGHIYRTWWEKTGTERRTCPSPAKWDSRPIPPTCNTYQVSATKVSANCTFPSPSSGDCTITPAGNQPIGTTFTATNTKTGATATCRNNNLPNCSIVSPTESQYTNPNGGNVEVKVNATDDGSISKVVLQTGSYKKGWYDLLDPVSTNGDNYTFSVPPLSPKEMITARVYARDNTNQWNQCEKMTIRPKDTETPKCSITSPSTSTKYVGNLETNVPINITATDDVSMDRVWLKTTAKYSKVEWRSETSTSNKYSFSYPIPIKNVKVEAYAYDRAGRNTFCGALDIGPNDKENPKCSILSPTGKQSIANKNSKIIVKMKATDDIAVNNIWISAWSAKNGTDDAKWYAGKADTAADTFSASIPIGEHPDALTSNSIINVFAFDMQGKKTLCGSVNVEPADTEPPKCSVTAPSGIQYITNKNDTIRIKTNATDDVAVSSVWSYAWSAENNIDDAKWYKGTTDTATNTYSNTIPIGGHKDALRGNSTINTFAYDTKGNRTFCGTILVEPKDTESPKCSIISPTGTKYIKNVSDPIQITTRATDDVRMNRVGIWVYTQVNGIWKKRWYYKKSTSDIYSLSAPIGTDSSSLSDRRFIDVWAADTKWKWTKCGRITVKPSDTIPPTCTSTLSTNKWTNKDVTVSAKCSDLGGSGCTENPKKQTIKEHGKTVTFTVTDKAGNTGTCTSAPAKIDRVAPTCSSTLDNTGWSRFPVMSSVVCSDTGGSGCRADSYVKTIKIDKHQGKGKFTVKDNAGNTGNCESPPAKIDITPPGGEAGIQ